MDMDRQIEGNHNRRMANQHRALVRRDRAEAKAEPMIGELCREGRPVYYCYPTGGKYYEHWNFYNVVDYLVRNRWVRV